MTTIRLGKHESMASEEYHRLPGISRSHLIPFKKSPYKYKCQRMLEREKKPTRDMILGSAFHTLVLEEHLFNDEYVVEPMAVKLKDVGRKIYDEYKDICDEISKTHKTVLTREEFDTLINMVICLEKHEEAYSMIKGIAEKPLIESSYFWQDEETGLLCKARPDILFSNMIVDLKTSRDASTRQYQKDMCDGMYHVQAAMIREAVKQCGGQDIIHAFNICVEKTYPYEVAIKIISENALAAGHREFKQLLKQMKECIDNDKWPSYLIETVELPSWY